MYLHVGWDEVVTADDVVTICDIDCWNSSRENREILEAAEAEGKVRRIRLKNEEEDKEVRSVIVYGDEILLSPITSTTLQHRANVLAQPDGFHRRLP
ncbi:MAG: DUF370 domain-containing protein [Bacillota bacterium]